MRWLVSIASAHDARGGRAAFSKKPGKSGPERSGGSQSNLKLT